MRFYERHNSLVRETHLILNSQNLKISEGRLLSLQTAERELYRSLDNSQYIKHRVDIDNTIFSHNNFNINKLLSSEEADRLREQENERQRRLEDLNKIDRRMDKRRNPQFRGGSERNNFLGAELPSSREERVQSFRRRSMTIDTEALAVMRKNFYKRTRLSKAGSQEGLGLNTESEWNKKKKSKNRARGARAIFFLINYFNSDHEFSKEDDFLRFFSKFYFDLNKNFTEFKVTIYKIICMIFFCLILI